MAKHEFAIMDKEPIYNIRFDSYEPYECNCISIHDNFIEPILLDLTVLDCYYHSLQVPGSGLAYCGITLIPPKSMDGFIKILLLQNKSEYNDLISLFNKAKNCNNYIIHCGI